jgi:hypothetical protein
MQKTAVIGTSTTYGLFGFELGKLVKVVAFCRANTKYN